MESQSETTQTVSALKLPILKTREYDLWSMRMEQYLTFTDHALWEVIVNGDLVLSIASASTEGPIPPKTAKQKLARKNKLKAKSTLILAIPDEHLLKFHACKDIKYLWEAIKNRFGGNKESKKMQKTILKQNYKNFAASKIKSQSSSSLNSQNVAFVSSDNPSSTNETVNTAHSLDNEDLKQIDTDDLKEMDLKWQVAMLTMRVKRFIQKTGRKLDLNGKDTVGFDRTKVECYSCYMQGHFARECKAPKNQGNRNRDAPTRNAPVDTSTTNALVVQDGISGYDWSFQAEEELTNFSLMAYTYQGSSSSSNSDSEVHTFSKECLKSYESLQKQYDQQCEVLNKSNLEIIGYQIGLESLEARIVVHEKNEAVYKEDIAFLKYDVQVKDISIKDLKNKTGLGYDGHVNESEVLNNVVDSCESDDNQVNDRFKNGEGYHAVPPPYTENYMPPRADLSFAGLDNSIFKYKVCEPITSMHKIESNASKNNRDSLEKPKTVRSSAPIIEDWESNSEDENVLEPKKKFSQSPRGNKRNWNGLMTQKLGDSFEFKKKACFVCGSINHLIKDCDYYENKMVLNNKGKITGPKEIRPLWDNTARMNHQNKFTHPHPKRNLVPTAVLTKSGQVPVNVAKQSSHKATTSVSTARHVNTAASRPNVNSALQITYFYFKAYSLVKRPFNQKSVAKTNNFNEKVNTAKDQGIFDSGCFRNMTGNKSYLIDYQEIDGGFVAFGKNAKGGKITGKSILFTNTECVVLSPDFKLLDESQVLRKVPGNNNMYSFDLKNVVPIGGLTCLFAKVTLDESNLWHRRLGHINFKTMNKLMRGNLARGPNSTEDEIADDAGKKSTKVPRKENEVQDLAKEGDKNDKEKDLRDQEEASRNHFEQEYKRLFGQREASKTNSTNRLNTVSSPVNVAYTYYCQLKVNAAKHKLTTAGDGFRCSGRRLKKPTESKGFEQIIDFINASYVKYALMVNPIVYTSCIVQFWASAKVKNVNREAQIQALVDKKKVIVTEASIRRYHRFEDEGGVDCLSNEVIFEQLILMSITMASAIICLATNQKFNFSKYIFDNTVKHLDEGVKFMMYLIFVQVFSNNRVEGTDTHSEIFVISSHTKKVFANMKREGNDFSRTVTPLFATMMVQALEDMGEGLEIPTDPHHTPIVPQPSSSQPKKKQNQRENKRKKLKFLHQVVRFLLRKVLDLEEAKTTQAKEIAGVKKRVKKLELKKEIKNFRAQKSKEEITLVDKTQEMMNEEDMFRVNDLDGDEVIVDVIAGENVEQSTKVAEKKTLIEIKAAKPKAITTAATTVTADGTRPKAKGIVMQEPKEREELSIKEKSRLFVELMDNRKKHFARLRAGNIRSKTPTKAQNRNQMCTYLKNMANYKHNQLKSKSFEEIQILFNNTMKWIEAFVPMDIDLEKGSDKAVEDSEKAKECSSERGNDDDVKIKATPISSKSPTIVDYKIYKEGKKSYFKIIRVDGNSQSYLTFEKMFKNFNREDLEVLWSIVKARFKKTKPIDDIDNLLFQTLKTMFEHHVKDNIWKYQQGLVKVLHWKLFDSCGVHCITTKNMVYYLLVEKMYPFTRKFLHQMWNDVRLQVDYEVEMAYDLLRLIRK
nr:hypothetical protein [Tanacetum cinerariifolium]